MLKLVFSIITVIVTIILAITCVYVKSNIYTRRFEHVAIASNLFWGAGIVGGAFFSLLIMWTLIEGYYAVSATFAAILWVANSLMYGWLNMYTTYDENGFTYGVLPVIKKRYSYDDISAIKEEGELIYLLADKKKILMNNSIIECCVFLEFVKQKYKEKNGEDISVIKTIPAWDPFKGNIKNGEGYFLVMVFISALTLTMLLYSLYDAQHFVTEEDSFYYEMVMDSYEFSDEHFIMTREGVEYVVFQYSRYDNAIESLVEALERRCSLHVYVIESERRHDFITQYEICAIQNDYGKEYISFDEYNQENMEDSKMFVLIFAVLFLTSILYFVGMIVVGRNPWRFKKSIRNVFFHNSDIKGV